MLERRGFKLALVDRLRRRLAAIPRYAVEDFAEAVSSASVENDVFISDPSAVYLAAGSVIYGGTRIYCGPGTFHLGARSHLAGGVYVNAVRGEVSIGEGVAIGPYAVLVAYSNAVVADRPVVDSHFCADIVIGNNVFVGAGAIILPGVRVGSGAVVAAGAIVRDNVPDGALVGGSPARTLKRYLGRGAS